MSWQELQPFKRAASAAAPVRVGVRQIRDAPARALILIKSDILKLLGPAKRFRIALGSAEQRHQLRIAVDEVGPFEPEEVGKAKGGGVFRFLLPPLDRFPECKVEAQAADYQHDKAGKAIIVDLPAWAWNEKVKLDLERAAGVR